MNAVITAYKAVARHALEQAPENSSIVVFHNNRQYIWIADKISYHVAVMRELAILYDFIRTRDYYAMCIICNRNQSEHVAKCKYDDTIIKHVCHYCKIAVDTSRPHINELVILGDSEVIWHVVGGENTYYMVFGGVYYTITNTTVIIPQITTDINWLEHEARFRAFLTMRLICDVMGVSYDVSNLITKRVLTGIKRRVVRTYGNARFIDWC